MDPYTCAKVSQDPQGISSPSMRDFAHQKLVSFFGFFWGGGFLQLATAKGPGRILTLWQCAAKVILAFLMFAVLVLRVNECRPYTPF